MTIENIFCSHLVKESSYWSKVNTSLDKTNSILVDEEERILICDRSELEFYKENTRKDSSIICIEDDNSLFSSDELISSENHYLFTLKVSELDLLDELIRFNFSTQKEVLKIEKKKLISNSIKEINKITYQETELVNESLFNIKAFINIHNSINKMIELYNGYLKDSNVKVTFSIFEKESNDQASYVIPISSEHTLGVEADLEELNDEEKSIILNCINELNNYYEKFGFRDEKNLDTHWQEIFSVFPLPMAIMSQEGALLYHNNLFSKLKLLPKQCFEFENNQNIEVGNQYYICHKEEIEYEDENLLYFQFMGTQKGDDDKLLNNQGTFQDLGIVSSSIAHELNNPLAGILSAIEVLTLIDKETEDLIELKKAASRCKELVSVFLGFAKSRPSLTIEECSLEALFNNALTLLRFRTIEANVRLEINIKEISIEKNKFNSSIITMVFYLLLNDILTEFEHRKLITDNKDELTVLKGSFSYNNIYMKIELDTDLISLNDIKFNKLVYNLIQLEDLNWEAEENFIQLSL